jgi:hypothetical protein
MTTVAVQILGASFFSTHHASAADVLAGRERAVTAPAYALLVGRSRRFTSLATQMHLEVCGALQGQLDDKAPPATVFATCHGEIQTAETLIADFRATAMVSSARFALSVHNTPSGLYSVATGSTAPSTTITGANAVAAGWLDAALTALDGGRSVLLSIADEPVPAIFQGPNHPAGVAAAFLLRAPAGDGPGVRAALATAPSDGHDDLDPLQVLAAAVDAVSAGAPRTLRLGPIQPGAALEVQIG